MNDELSRMQTNLFKFGLLLGNMGKYDSAEKYINHYLNQLSDNNPHIVKCYRALGLVFYIKGDYDSSLKLYNQCLEMTMQRFQLNTYIYIDFGSVYEKKHDYNRAIELYEKGLGILKDKYTEDHSDLIVPFSKIGSTFLLKRNFFKALEIASKSCHSNHPNRANAYRNLGLLHILRLVRSKWKWFWFIFFSGTTFANPLPYFSRRTSYTISFFLILFMFILYFITIDQ